MRIVTALCFFFVASCRPRLDHFHAIPGTDCETKWLQPTIGMRLRLTCQQLSAVCASLRGRACRRVPWWSRSTSASTPSAPGGRQPEPEPTSSLQARRLGSLRQSERFTIELTGPGFVARRNSQLDVMNADDHTGESSFLPGEICFELAHFYSDVIHPLD